MSTSGLTFSALEQIGVIAATLRTAAGKTDPGSVENLRLAVFGPDSEGDAS